MNAPSLSIVGMPPTLDPNNPSQSEIEAVNLAAKRANMALREQTFEIAFETILERITEGTPLERIAREYHTHLPIAALRTWIYRDLKRRNAYMTAKALGAEALEDELIRIADGIKNDGSASLDDVQRSKLRIDVRWKIMQVANRKRYGDVKQVNTSATVTTDITRLSDAELDRRIAERLGITIEGDELPSTVFDDIPPDDF